MINTIIVVVLGAIAGILVNYLADVLPLTRRLSAPLCRECGHQFQLGEYLFAWRCSQCQSRPPFRNYLVVIGMMLLSFLVAVFPIKGLSFWAAIPLFAFLILILTIDMEYRAVLNETSIAGAILMLIFGVFMNGIVKTLLGGVAGYGAMLLLYFGGILFTRVLSKIRHQEIDEVALGFGDVNVTGFLGLLVGWPAYSFDTCRSHSTGWCDFITHHPGIAAHKTIPGVFSHSIHTFSDFGSYFCSLCSLGK